MATNQSITDGIPTARNVDHFGYNVPNLDEAIDFFVEALGAKEAFHWGPMADPDGDTMAAMLGVHRERRSAAHCCASGRRPTSSCSNTTHPMRRASHRRLPTPERVNSPSALGMSRQRPSISASNRV